MRRNFANTEICINLMLMSVQVKVLCILDIYWESINRASVTFLETRFVEKFDSVTSLLLFEFIYILNLI